MALKVNISTGTDQPLSKAPSVVSVITAEDIKATGATNLTDILQTVPGIYVRANLFSFRPIVTFRGASGNQTLLLLNGEPMNDLVWTSGIYWSGLSVNAIDRIEIIRGPGSALYGERAVAGVINVITRTAGKIRETEAGVRAGNFGSQEGWFQDGGIWSGFDIGFTANLSHTDGHNPFIPKDAMGNGGHAGYGWNGQELHFSAARDHWRLLTDYIGHREVETGLSGGGFFDPLTRGSDNRLNLALLYDNKAFAPDWRLNAELRYHWLDYSSGAGFQEQPPGYSDAYPDGLINRQRAAEQGAKIEVSGVYSGLHGHTIRIGGGSTYEDLYKVRQWYGSPTSLANLTGTPEAFAPEKSRQVDYLFAQDIWALADLWELTAGARYDHYSDFGSALSPRLALVWKTTPKLATKLMYGEAFRAPTFLELYAVTAATNPNPNLQPEKSRTVDLLFSYAARPGLNLSVDLYQFYQSNLIAANPDAGNRYDNYQNNTSRGIELEAQWQATPTLGLRGNVSRREIVRATFIDRSVPEDKAYLRLDWAFLPRWNWDIQANWIGDRKLPAGDPRQPLPDYTLVDTTLRYKQRAGWEFAASARNLLNANAREYTSKKLTDNLPLSKRGFYAEIRYLF